jgi:hypothetical protein
MAALALVLIAVTMGLSLAHALEFPGKLRLDRETYARVQAIYYPGFAFGGLVGELGGLIATAVAFAITPFGSERSWWIAAAFAFLVATHAIYWLVTHPVNNFWLKDTDVSRIGGAFFATFSRRHGNNWEKVRDTWEYSHIARSVFAMASLIAMTVALLH